MTKEQTAVHARSDRAVTDAPDMVPTTKRGAVTTRAESQRMTVWLASKQPNFSVWRKRRH